jgi:2'-hydroxyisoflavone reductase
MDISKAVKAGLTFRPLAETARDTLTYFHKQTPERQAQLKAGLAPEKEQQVLAEWRAKAGR